MTMGVVIPIYRLQDAPLRVAALRHVLSRVRERLAPDRIVLAEQIAPGVPPWTECDGMADSHVAVEREGEYCRSAAINAGVRAAACEVVLILDGDTCLDWPAVKAMAETLPEGTVCQPYSEARRLPADLTRQAMETGQVVLSRETIRGLETTSMLGAIAVLIRTTDYWRVDGFDERYVGWGVEDNAFGRTCWGMLDVCRIDRPAYHLDHGRDKPSLMATEAYRRNRELYRSTVFPTRPVKGLALVACSWGSGTAHAAATRQAVGSWFRCSPLPEVFVFVEAVAEGMEELLRHDRGDVHYVSRSLGPEHRHLFHKEALWNLGLAEVRRAYPGVRSVLFMDSHLAVSSSVSFFADVAAALDHADVIQPFSTVADSADGTVRKGLVAQWSRNVGWGTPGFALAATMAFLDRMDGFPLVPTSGGDAATWNRLLRSKQGGGPVLDHGPAFRRDARFSAIVPRPTVAFLDTGLTHISHGPTSDRHYAEQDAILEYACSRFGDLCTADSNGLLVAANTPEASAFQACMGRIREVHGNREVRDLWDAELQSRMPRIDEAHPLTVVCVLRSGGTYEPRHVRWLRDQVAAHLLTPHRFLCLADCDVSGVETIPMIHGLPVTRSKLELFRSDLFTNPDESVLFVDLDTVVMRDFTLPVCPAGRIHYIRERDRRAAWPAWGSGVMCFRGGGQFSRIIDRFLEDRVAGRAPEWQFPGEQEFSSYCVYFERLAEVCDIERLLAVRLFDGHWHSPQPPSEAHFVTWTAARKPWATQASWIPPLTESANDR